MHLRPLRSLFTPATLILLFPLASASSFKRSTACNNSPSLCSRSYNNITHLGAHDSPFLRDASTDYSESGNQAYNSTVQLDAGVRLLTAQLHNNASSSSSSASWQLCHTSCTLLDAGSLSSWLTEIRTWLDSNPNDVVTILIVNSDNADASEIAAQYAAADIEGYAYTPANGSSTTEWPTLQTMINNGSRLVSFVASLDNNTDAPYLLSEFDYIFENDYDNTSPSDFNCTANRPSSVDGDTAAALSQGLMPLMNHFLYNDTGLFGIEVPDTSALNVTNAPSGGAGNLGTSAAQCASEYGGRAPTFILVDFFHVGPAIATVDSLNGLTDPVGRTTVSEALQAASSGAGRHPCAHVLGFTASIVAVVLALL